MERGGDAREIELNISFILSMILLFLVGFIISAKGQSEEEAGPIEEKVGITYFTFSAAPDHLKDLDEMIEIFEASHKGITIKVETASWDDYFTKLQTLIAGGTAPDVFELNYENFVSYASKGVLLDLNSIAGVD
ncbi:unnamed protein product, partial [marine sediment metagenome]